MDLARRGGVANQPPPLVDYNVFTSDIALTEALRRESAALSVNELDELGLLAGSAQAQTWAGLANEHTPQLRAYDRYGNRIDEVVYDPAYHELMRVAMRYGLHATPWAGAEPAAHLLRAAKFYVWAQVEAGHGCPISMTYASIPALRTNAALARLWEPHFISREYDPQLRPIGEKFGATCGMAMTEKQGGSDVRANETRAEFLETSDTGDAYTLNGHKWFCSAPMSDAFLMLAQTGAGLTCFFLPRVLPDGSRNRIFIARLKDKLGNRSNASSEIELRDTYAVRVGEEGRGVQTIVEMVNYTRLDCINGSAALMRAATAQAVHHARYRHAFGKALIDQPLMQNVLADLALESEAALVMLLRLARGVDQSSADSHETAVKRLGTAAAKYYVCKRAPAIAAEALECLGGNGYVEESGMPRLYREAPLNSIWEGSGNINALDVLRIFSKERGALEAFRAEVEPALSDARMHAAADELFHRLHHPLEAERAARWIVERIAVLWQAALLARDPSSEVADAFIESRIAGRWGRTMGTLPPSESHARIAARALPAPIMEYSTR
ncbi:MAG TPA: acyl-CoA dehydrogenase family protein [Candidatus Baltobacteraceae bacterium]|jgi:putative acyl-CoA dehydrogenase|nr:acyl-CoA dehydrogenase family protein [Candidatus Baltobacteraceae bacterium]